MFTVHESYSNNKSLHILRRNSNDGTVSHRNKISFGFHGTDLHSDTAITDTNWYHGVFTYSNPGSSGARKLYLDGSLDKNDTHAALDIDGASEAYIGKYTGSDEIDGQIFDVRIYNRALSATEITTLYNITRSDFATNFAIQSNPSVNVNYIPVESKIFTSDKGFTDHKGKLITKPHAVRSDALVGWWKLDEGYGDKAFDSSGNAVSYTHLRAHET